MQLNKDEFELLRKIDNKNNLYQRELDKKLGFSLGKLNYCLKGLVNKGLVKLNNFKNNKNKLNYVYLLTPKGVSHKISQTINFMNLKFKEYEADPQTSPQEAANKVLEEMQETARSVFKNWEKASIEEAKRLYNIEIFTTGEELQQAFPEDL